MATYSRGMNAERSCGGLVWQLILAPFVLAAAYALGTFYYCDDRVDRSAYRIELDQVKFCSTAEDLDRLLRLKFEKETDRNRVTFIARPLGQGACSCAVVELDQVEATLDGAGHIATLSVSRPFGLAKRR